MRTELKLLAIIAALLAVWLAIAYEKSKIETPITVTQSNMALPQGGFLKIGELREEAGTVYRWTGGAWIVNGTGTADISRWPTVGIKEEEVREDEITGKRFVFRGGQWLEIVQTGGSLPEEVKDELENYLDIELGEDYDTALRPIFMYPDGKAYVKPNGRSAPFNSIRVGVSGQTGRAGDVIKVVPVGPIKNLTGVVPKGRYEARFAVEIPIGDTYVIGQQAANVGNNAYLIGSMPGQHHVINVVDKSINNLILSGSAYGSPIFGFTAGARLQSDGTSIHVFGGDVVTEAGNYYNTHSTIATDGTVTYRNWNETAWAFNAGTVRSCYGGGNVYVAVKNSGYSSVWKYDGTTWTVASSMLTVTSLTNTIMFYDDRTYSGPSIAFIGSDNGLTQTRLDLYTSEFVGVLGGEGGMPYDVYDGAVMEHPDGGFIILPTNTMNNAGLGMFVWNDGYVGQYGHQRRPNLNGIRAFSHAGTFYGAGFLNSSMMTPTQSVFSEIKAEPVGIFTINSGSMQATPYMFGISTTSAYVLPVLSN